VRRVTGTDTVCEACQLLRSRTRWYHPFSQRPVFLSYFTEEGRFRATASMSTRFIKRICVFCGSSLGVRPEYGHAAAQLGRLLAGAGLGLVYGGARVGLMGALADAVLEAGGEAIGVMPRALVEKEIAHSGLTELHVVETMHERKTLMSDLADAFVLLPGGFGSWEEFCEAVTWLQLGMHQKPCGVLNVVGYYDALMALSAHAAAEGFLRPAHRDLVIVADNPQQLLLRLSVAPTPAEVKWVTKDER
jgi:uncharacterized protein (TIGR00730 family)